MLGIRNIGQSPDYNQFQMLVLKGMNYDLALDYEHVAAYRTENQHDSLQPITKLAIGKLLATT